MATYNTDRFYIGENEYRIADTLSSFAKTDESNTFSEGQKITRSTSGAILELESAASNTNFLLTRTSGAQCVLEAGAAVGLIGTKTNHELQIRTNYANRMSIGIDGSVTLASAPDSSSDNNQVATTGWTNDRIDSVVGDIETLLAALR